MYTCIGVSFQFFKKKNQSVFAENILSKRSVSHATSKITTDKSTCNYVKSVFLTIYPETFRGEYKHSENQETAAR